MSIIKGIVKYPSRVIWHGLVNSFASKMFVPKIVRSVLYRISGMDIKSNSIMPGNFFMWKSISIGSKTFVNRRCFFDITTTIGDNCAIGYEVMFCSSTHEIGSSKRRAGKSIGDPIKVENGCWIGARSIILPGVTIGEGSIIAAGSVVTKDCEPNSLYAGVPARKVRDLPLEKDDSYHSELNKAAQ